MVGMRKAALALAGLLVVSGCPCGTQVCTPAQYCYALPAGATSAPDASGTQQSPPEGTEYLCKDEPMALPRELDCDQKLRAITCRSAPKP
jgi:hypothetical protein